MPLLEKAICELSLIDLWMEISLETSEVAEVCGYLAASNFPFNSLVSLLWGGQLGL